MSIFLSVASYCDPVLDFTLRQAAATARWPDRLHFGVIDQSPAGSPAPDREDLGGARLSYVRLDPVFARGPCWARSLAMSLYDGEDWYFQLDSHMDFDRHWDETLIRHAEALLPGRPGVVLSSYPNAFVFEDGRPQRRSASGHVLAHVVKPGTSFAADHLVLGFEAHPLEAASPVHGFHLGAGCLFAPGTIVQTLPYDPWFYFHGEEQALAARLFTHGWDIFHVPGLPVYHLYNNAQSGSAPRPLHWDDQEDRRRDQAWWRLEQRSRARVAALLSGASLGAYGLGRARTMADYADFSGIDFSRRTIAPRAFDTLTRLLQPGGAEA